VIFRKCKGPKGAWPRSRYLLSILGSLQYFRNGESYKLPKVVNGMTVISGQSLHCGPRSRAHSGRGWGGGLGALPPETKHLHTCQSILLAILFKNVLKMLKISQPQPATFSHTGGDLPRPPLDQPEASCGNLVSSRL